MELEELVKKVSLKDLKEAAKELGIKLGRCPKKTDIAKALPKGVLEKLASKNQLKKLPEAYNPIL